MNFSSSGSTVDDKVAEIEAEIAKKLSEIDAEIAEKLSGLDSVITISSDDSDGSIDTSGSDDSDSITGSSDNNIVAAGLGSDTLTGSSDADTFVFNTLDEGVDIITDFSAAEGDKIQVSAEGFGIAPNDFSHFSFNEQTGALFFNGLQLASLPSDSGFTVSTDIIIV